MAIIMTYLRSQHSICSSTTDISIDEHKDVIQLDYLVCKGNEIFYRRGSWLKFISR